MLIRMPRGDIRLVGFVVKDLDGTQSTIDFTEVYFTVKKTFKDQAFLFQKKLSSGGIVKLEDGHYQVKIEPEDTERMAYGNYKFDVQLVYIKQLKETFTGDFTLTEEATHKANE